MIKETKSKYYIRCLPKYDKNNKPVEFHAVDVNNAMKFSLHGAFWYMKNFKSDINIHYSYRNFQHVIIPYV